MENEENLSDKGEIEADSGQDQDGKDTEIEKLKKDLLYLRADFDNFKKRNLREQEQAIKFGNERLIVDLGKIVDNFERALNHVPMATDEGAKRFIDGIKLTHAEFIQLLQRFGVEFIGASNEKFDPTLHEAVAEKTVEGIAPGKVAEVMERGCLLHGRLIKPARVVVSKKE